MIKTTIGEILKGSGPDDSGTCIYVIRDGETVFYVGKSDHGTMDRIRQHCGSGSWRCKCDAVGELIMDNAPESGAWQVELLTLAECARFVQALDPECNRYDVRTAEEAMIQALGAHVNTQLNNQSKPLPEQYRRKELAEMRRAIASLHVPYQRPRKRKSDIG